MNLKNKFKSVLTNRDYLVGSHVQMMISTTEYYVPVIVLYSSFNAQRLCEVRNIFILLFLIGKLKLR